MPPPPPTALWETTTGTARPRPPELWRREAKEGRREHGSPSSDHSTGEWWWPRRPGEDDDPEDALAKRNTPVQKAQSSDGAKRKAASKTMPEGLPVHSMADLLSHLGGLTLNGVSLRGQPGARFTVTCEPTRLQANAFALLELPPEPRVHNRPTV